ncbi:MAG TPA: PGPGW domain-containing protein [Candidatus Paceibacterota bacterium]
MRFAKTKDRLKRFFAHSKVRKVLGVIFVIIGFVALVTPFTPGSWLIIVGLLILGVRHPLLDRANAIVQKIWQAIKSKIGSVWNKIRRRKSS